MDAGRKCSYLVPVSYRRKQQTQRASLWVFDQMCKRRELETCQTFGVKWNFSTVLCIISLQNALFHYFGFVPATFYVWVLDLSFFNVGLYCKCCSPQFHQFIINPFSSADKNLIILSETIHLSGVCAVHTKTLNWSEVFWSEAATPKHFNF